MIRVLCVFSTLVRGGSESMCMNLYRNMDRTKVQFDYVKHTSEKGAFEDEIQELGGKIYEAPRLKIYNYRTYCNWWKNHFKNHPEHQIVHGHFFTISAVYFHIAHKFGRKTIGHVHASHSDELEKKLLVKRIETEADYCFACSENAGKWVFPHKDFFVLNNAADTEELSFNEEIRENYRLKLGLKDKIVLGTVANFSSVKNPMGLIDIFRAYKSVNPESCLLWVGDGDLRDKIENKIKELKLEDSIILLGKRDDVPKILQTMDLFLLPSLNEGLPVSVIEAQAAGLPCYLSDTITKEVNITGLCKFLPLNNIGRWIDALNCPIEGRTDTSDLIKKSGYDIKETSRWLQAFYESIV